jgi:hypothetical protein
MKIYAATWLLEQQQGEVLTTVGQKNRLLSFFYLMKISSAQLSIYCKTGKTEKHENISRSKCPRK